MATTLEVRRIEYGEIITEDGIYDMPLEWYHADCCDGPSVSSTGLRMLDLQTPQHFYDKWSGNPLRDPDDPDDLEADHFRIGRAGHWRILEPALFEQNIAVRPEIFKDWRTKDSQDWRRDIQAMHRFTILTREEMKRVDGVAQALSSHPLHKEGILGGLVEASMIVRDKKTGIWIKSRPDSIPIGESFSDLKIMNDVSPQSVDKAIRTLGYDMQMSLAGICFYLLTGITIDQFWIVAVESRRPHAIHVASISTDAVYWARIRIRKALDVLRKCLDEEYWPAYGADGQKFSPAPSKVQEWEALQKANLLPKDDGFVEDRNG